MEAPSFVINPVKIYEVNGEVCTLQCAQVSTAVANNQVVVAAVTGKRIRVMGLDAQAGAATGSFTFKSGSGGTVLYGTMSVPVATNGDKFEKPIVDCGYFETATGIGLYVDVATTGINFNVFYITYKP